MYAANAARPLPRLPAPDPPMPADGRRGPARGPRLDSRDQARWLRLIARREGERVRLLTRNGYNWADRFPLIFAAVAALAVRSCVIDGEAILCDTDGLADFERLRSRRHDTLPRCCAPSTCSNWTAATFAGSQSSTASERAASGAAGGRGKPNDYQDRSSRADHRRYFQ
jgi:hypothetical protein